MQQKTFFNELEASTQEPRASLERTEVIRRCLDGQVELQTYQAFLTEAYHHVKHTVPLLMACGARLPDRLDWLRGAIVHYVEEEYGHQEWILNDLQNCGIDKESVRKGNPQFATEMMISYAYDTVNRGNPVGLFGMVYTLEKTSVTIATRAAGQIAASLQLPEDAMSYLISHGSLDLEHMQHFETLMNRLDDPDDRQAVLHAASVFYPLYREIFVALPTGSQATGGISHAA